MNTIWYVTLHFRDRHGAPLLRYINRSEITVLMCEHKLYPYGFRACAKAIGIVWTTVADPDLQIRGGGEGGGDHPDPEIRGGAVSSKNFFRPFGPQFGLKIRGCSAPPPGSSPRQSLRCFNFSIACYRRSDSGERCEVPLHFSSLSLLRTTLQYLNAWNRLTFPLLSIERRGVMSRYHGSKICGSQQ